MPYNTRRKSLSLPSLGIHIPVSHAARAAAAAAAAAAASNNKRQSNSSMPRSSSRPESVESQPSKRQKRAHLVDATIVEQTPPPSPTPDDLDLPDAERPPKIDLEGINDDIVEAVIVQLESTANRPHLVKELATVLAQRLASVQHSANPCAIISSRLAAYLKRSCWSALAPCPLAKELETVHPRRTYFFLTTCPRQPLPEPNAAALPNRRDAITPSVSLTDDSTSDDADARRRELSPSPEVDLSPEFEDGEDDFTMPMTPIGSLPSHHPARVPHRRDQRHNSPPLEKDEREFTQTADVLLKRKLNAEVPAVDISDRDDAWFGGGDRWFGDSRLFGSTTWMTSPLIKPSTVSHVVATARKEDEVESWRKLTKLLEWDRTAESIEIDELDGLLDSC